MFLQYVERKLKKQMQFFLKYTNREILNKRQYCNDATQKPR